jgi:hypothetical protein
MTTPNATLVQRHRRRHPDRAEYVKRRNEVRRVVALRLARMFPAEFERLYRAEMRRRHLPLTLPPLPASEDFRRNGKKAK